MGPGGRLLLAPEVRVQIFFMSLSFRGTVPACWAMVRLEYAAELFAGSMEGFCELGTEEIAQKWGNRRGMGWMTKAACGVKSKKYVLRRGTDFSAQPFVVVT